MHRAIGIRQAGPTHLRSIVSYRLNAGHAEVRGAVGYVCGGVGNREEIRHVEAELSYGFLAVPVKNPVISGELAVFQPFGAISPL